MEILQLEHFLAIVDEGTFTRAAERVFRTQPALSQSIKKLEEEIGAPLFARNVHDLSLTEAGKLLAKYAHRMINLRDEVARRIGQLKNLETGTLSIAAHESAAVYLLPGYLRHYLRLFPQIKVGIYRNQLGEIPRRVIDRDVQVGFVKEQPMFHELQSVVVHEDEMTLIASPQNRIASRPIVCIRDLGTVPFVVHHMCQSTEEVILRLFEEHHTRCRIVAELWSFENVKSFVQEDVGLAIVPRITVAEELRTGVLTEVPVEELKIPRRTIMIFRRDYLSDSARQFIRVLRTFNPVGVSLGECGSAGGVDSTAAGAFPEKGYHNPRQRIVPGNKRK
jgi:DNA-binding transcriptional LysR family regulator